MCAEAMTLASLLALSIGLNVWLICRLEKTNKYYKRLSKEAEKVSSMIGLYRYSRYGRL